MVRYTVKYNAGGEFSTDSIKEAESLKDNAIGGAEIIDNLAELEKKKEKVIVVEPIKVKTEDLE